MLARPLMIGTPSSRGRGTVSAMPTFVPTHRRPLEGKRSTIIDVPIRKFIRLY